MFNIKGDNLLFKVIYIFYVLFIENEIGIVVYFIFYLYLNV